MSICDFGQIQDQKSGNRAPSFVCELGTNNDTDTQALTCQNCSFHMLIYSTCDHLPGSGHHRARGSLGWRTTDHGVLCVCVRVCARVCVCVCVCSMSNRGSGSEREE